MIRKRKFIFCLKIIFFLLILSAINKLYKYYNVFIGDISKNESFTINHHNYTYIINPGESICKYKILTLIAFVTTQNDNFIQRETIRATWSNQALFPQMRVIFMIGSSNNIEITKKIKNESKFHGDIVQVSFEDDDLTIKSIQGIKWVSKYCSNAKYVLKVNDDIIVNLFILLKYLNNLTIINNNNVLCYVHKNKQIDRRLESTFYVSYDETNASYYLPYCDGRAYMFEGNLAKSLYQASLRVRYFKFEEIYFSLLVNYLNLNFIDLKAKYTKNEFDSKLAKNKFFIHSYSNNNSEIYKYSWSKLVFYLFFN
jgi:hypothetical protein